MSNTHGTGKKLQCLSKDHFTCHCLIKLLMSSFLFLVTTDFFFFNISPFEQLGVRLAFDH
jgi:hypothetical protein